MVKRGQKFKIGDVTMSDGNYKKAVEEADKIEENIISVLASGKNFRVEAGAGSGKTYSLLRVIEWLEKNKWSHFKKNHQQVACLTYTNTAVDVIANRLNTNSFIIPCTIHSFAWEAIKQYQKFLISHIRTTSEFQLENTEIKEIQYNLGYRYVEDGVLYLYHNDVINLFVRLLDEAKFRRIFASKYPLILIDEYQDSFKIIIDKFKDYFISPGTLPQFGFFGDSWQTIYQSNNPCGIIEDNNIIEIKKVSNFRSAPYIVNLLNKIRPDLPQISAIDSTLGEIIVVHNNDFCGERRNEKNFKGDLPIDELKKRINTLENIFCTSGTSKTLMITHRILSEQQGYEDILKSVGDKFKEKDEDILLFVSEIAEPLYTALNNKDMKLLFQVLGVRHYPINKKSEKQQWLDLYSKLSLARNGKIIDVMSCIMESKLIPVPDKILNYYKLYKKGSDIDYLKTTLRAYLNIKYSQFIAAVDFFLPESQYSTSHGVKGEEYDNVIFVVGKGWNNYQFDKFMPMSNTRILPEYKEAFIRNRNLFYVCCSRPKNKLLIFVSLKVDNSFEEYLRNLVGNENYYSFSEFIKKYST